MILSARALDGLKSYQYKSGGYTILDDLHNPMWNCEEMTHTCARTHAHTDTHTHTHTQTHTHTLTLTHNTHTHIRSHLLSMLTMHLIISQIWWSAYPCGLHQTSSHSSEPLELCALMQPTSCTMRASQVRFKPVSAVYVVLEELQPPARVVQGTGCCFG